MKIFIKLRLMQIAIALVLVMGLVCSLSVPVFAKDNKGNISTDSNTQMTIIKGTVTGITSNAKGSSFEVTKSDNSKVPITVDSNTKYYEVQARTYATTVMGEVQQSLQDFRNNQPNDPNQRGLGDKNGQVQSTGSNDDEVNSAINNPQLEQGLISNWQGPKGFFDRVKSWFGGWHGFGKAVTFKDIEVGDGVIVGVMPNETLAKQVLIIKPLKIKQISGTVGGVSSGSNTFTVTPKDTGVAAVTLTIDDNTSVMLKGAIGMANGQCAIVVYKAQSGGTNLAITIRVTPKEPTTGLFFITGITSDSVSLPGTLATAFTISTNGVKGTMHTLGLTGTVATPALADGSYGFTLTPNSSQTTSLEDYFTAKGWNNSAWTSQINAEITGSSPFFYLNAAGGIYSLVDNFKRTEGISPATLTIDDDYPVGTYVYTGTLTGTNGGTLPVTVTLMVTRTH